MDDIFNKNLIQREVPDTPKGTYIGSFYALNIETPEDTFGDWHYFNFWFCFADDIIGIDLNGTNQKLDTNKIFGDWGIHIGNYYMKKRGIIFNNKKVYYVSSHYRAVLDLVYDELLALGEVTEMIGASEDYFDTEEEKRYLLDNAKRMIPYLTDSQVIELNKWIDRESKPGYKS